MTDFNKIKFYDCKTAPSPRIVRIFLAEKGIELPTILVNLKEKEQLNSEFKSINPQCEVPALKLEDGTLLTESSAICRFLERECPNPPLFGNNGKEDGIISMWARQIEIRGFQAIAEALRNSNPRFEDRAITGPVDFKQIPELADRGLARTQLFFVELDKQLSNNKFIAGDQYSMADINALVCVDFAKVVKQPIQEEQNHLKRWHELVSSRPSASV